MHFYYLYLLRASCHLVRHAFARGCAAAADCQKRYPPQRVAEARKSARVEHQERLLGITSLLDALQEWAAYGRRNTYTRCSVPFATTIHYATTVHCYDYAGIRYWNLRKMHGLTKMRRTKRRRLQGPESGESRLSKPVFSPSRVH